MQKFFQPWVSSLGGNFSLNFYLSQLGAYFFVEKKKD
jgi:hypothetical protein